ncbi:RNA polymerase sigma factor [Phytoactinopolyspora endophytica]|uniref:RNA polymerase sigma factor n=1 Tax=Phytoactinopolyspora endophytica TaxID=1642495 RepID=UPI00101D0CA0|nr:sigma-70 family RNA polymerase sigma factor [Phytoactinopolyspora endophytica]
MIATSTQSAWAEIDDEECVARARDGDAEAYATLYRRHYPRALRLARALIGPQRAEDVVADAFVRVLVRLRAGARIGCFSGYAHATVRHLVVDAHRTTARAAVAVTPDRLDSLPGDDEPAQRVIDAEHARWVFLAMPASWRQLVWDTTVHGNTPARLARRREASTSAITAQLYRARRHLRAVSATMPPRARTRY